MKIFENENKWVAQVVNESDSRALKKLFNKYKPMVETVAENFYIRTFDHDDWIQEGLIVCHETCFKFDGSQGSKFGSFFKLRFENHARSLLRKELAKKRTLDKISSSYEESINNDSADYGILGSRVKNEYTLDPLELDGFYEILSEIEFEAFKVLMGKASMEEVCENYHCSVQQVNAAMARCKKKFVDFIK